MARDLLTSVKKTEDSLLKLQLGRRSAVNISSGMSDDNKIRLQLSLDIAAFSQQVSTNVGEAGRGHRRDVGGAVR